MFRRSWLAMVAMVVCCGAATAQDSPAPQKTVRLFTIGNSFSNDATFFLDDLAKADGNLLIQKGAVVGGSPLELHWNRAQLNEKDSTDAKGHYTAGKGLKELLAEDRWDFVTIQQASIKSHDIATYRPFAANLQAYVKQHAPQAELLLHETWAYRVDDPRFSVAKPKEGEPKTQQEMYEMLARSYRTIASELGMRVIPVGAAMFAADRQEKWGYKVDLTFDPKTVKAPQLPDQTHSLHVGRRWSKNAKGEETLSMDGHHASTAGRYLGACVWYELLFKKTCIGNKFTAGLDADYARFLQETAHAAVK